MSTLVYTTLEPPLITGTNIDRPNATMGEKIFLTADSGTVTVRNSITNIMNAIKRALHYNEPFEKLDMILLQEPDYIENFIASLSGKLLVFTGTVAQL